MSVMQRSRLYIYCIYTKSQNFIYTVYIHIYRPFSNFIYSIYSCIYSNIYIYIYKFFFGGNLSSLGNIWGKISEGISGAKFPLISGNFVYIPAAGIYTKFPLMSGNLHLEIPVGICTQIFPREGIFPQKKN